MILNQRTCWAEFLSFFATIPAGEPIDRLIRQEPAAERGATGKLLNGPGDTAYLNIAYRVPAATHPDYYALTLLNATFAGGSSLGMFAGGGSNRSSRLYKALVDTELAVAAGAGLAPTLDPFLYTIKRRVKSRTVSDRGRRLR